MLGSTAYAVGITLDSFVEQLERIGMPLIIDPNVTDKPDLGFELRGRKIGVELTTLTFQEYEHWQRKKEDKDELRRIRLPNTPEEWAQNAIDSKSSKIRSYNSDNRFSEVWLLLHVGNIPAFGNDKDTVAWLRWVASSSRHDFSEIWFLGEKGNLVRLQVRLHRT